jgi:hypothetical protein
MFRGSGWHWEWLLAGWWTSGKNVDHRLAAAGDGGKKDSLARKTG